MIHPSSGGMTRWPHFRVSVDRIAVSIYVWFLSHLFQSFWRRSWEITETSQWPESPTDPHEQHLRALTSLPVTTLGGCHCCAGFYLVLVICIFWFLLGFCKACQFC